MKIAAVIPTYNERGNIGPLVGEVLAALSRPAWQVHVLVVDDESPDGTAEEVKRLATRQAGVSLLSGPRAGLGAAYVRGLDHVLATFAPNIVIQMDADFSHLPSDLPRLVEAIEQGADLAIGSRYLEGNRTPPDWGWRRRMLSWGGNLVARHWLGLAPVRDCTAGFRAWRASALVKADYAEVTAQGYVFLVALLQRAVQARLRVREVPVVFPDRKVGESKLGYKEIAGFAHWAILHRAPSNMTPQPARATR
ncbi:polyprenol monophosphomannose synthase [Azoarcus sp. KH32C]|uniref:polyprenol monophosphomannose synthase n=1 Tax=Azoarcus sp. KH32C TaxID=748247 RepID=UPI0002386AF2|nr:polyprenol monophosphomannose synthase [Azoarcus sp. KH32C]BAL22718.1 glycosyltransferase family protein [Azoarcus sp. KH32C]